MQGEENRFGIIDWVIGWLVFDTFRLNLSRGGTTSALKLTRSGTGQPPWKIGCLKMIC